MIPPTLALGLLAISTAPAPASANAPAPATPRMGQAALSRALPRYPGATSDPISVGDTIVAKGVPMNVQSFMTDDPPRKVLDFYEAYFKTLKLPMLGNGDMVIKFPYPSVTVLDEAHDIDISVITVPSADRHTMVLLARADMRPLLAHLDRTLAERYGGLEPYPRGKSPSAVAFTDGEVQTTQVTFSTADTPAQVFAFYKSSFARAGAVLGGDGAAGEASFQLPDGVWRISTSSHPDQGATVVTAVHTRSPAPPPEPPRGGR